MAFPKQVAIFTASFDNVGASDETLKIMWNYEYAPGNFAVGNLQYRVGTECFLESPTSPTSISLVTEEQLLASISMCAILAGEVLPGTTEFVTAIGEQSTTNFQTIVGNAKLKIDPVAVVDASVGPLGTVYDLTFMRLGNTANTKVVRADAWTICQYGNRVDSPAHTAPCVPGAIHKQFEFKKSQLGAANSTNRQSVIDWVASQKFWV